MYEEKAYRSTTGNRYVNKVETDTIRQVISTYSPAQGDNSKITVLDIGAGNGRWSRLFLSMGFEVYSLDQSHEMCEILRKINGIHVIEGDIQTEELPIQNFDIIFSMRALKYVDLNRALPNIKKSIGKQGIIIIELPYAHNPFYLLARTVSFFLRRGRHFEYVKAIKMYSPSEIRSLSAEHGLEPVTVEKLYLFPHFIYSRINRKSMLQATNSIYHSLFKIWPRSFIFVLRRADGDDPAEPPDTKLMNNRNVLS